jgi:ribosomal protein L11 methyltransferase
MRVGREPKRRGRGAADTFRFEIDGPPDARDVLVAELFALGTLGLEETDAGLRAYFVDAEAELVRDVRALAGHGDGVVVRGPVRVPATDWSEAWRRGLGPRRIGPLAIRPSWCPPEPPPELCIDPEQAFGTGEHATTRLALALLLDTLQPGDRVLDVGTGSGILAMAALRMGARAAIGCDLDPAACPTAAGNAERNALPLALYTGTLAALRTTARFDVVVANMLLSEIRTCAAQLAAHAGRAVVLSGLLASERVALDDLAKASSRRVVRVATESQSGDDWLGAVLARGP